MKIVKGKQRHAARVTIYGTEGIGKSTLAAQFPRAIILDTEEGTGQIDCERVVCHDWVTLEGALQELARDRQGYETVVIDSADWAERHIVEQILGKSGKRSIEEFGFGKGYVMLAEHVARLLAVADRIIAGGANVVWVAHAKVVRTSPPDMDEGFDRYELKLTKHSAPLFKEWCDLLLFCNYRTQLVEGADGRTRAKGGKERIMHAERSAAWDAKNRFGLPASMPMHIDSLAPIFDRSEPVKGEPAKLKVVTVDVARLISETSAAIAKADAEQLRRLAPKVSRRRAAGELTADQAGMLLDQISARLGALEGRAAEYSDDQTVAAS